MMSDFETEARKYREIDELKNEAAAHFDALQKIAGKLNYLNMDLLIPAWHETQGGVALLGRLGNNGSRVVVRPR